MQLDDKGRCCGAKPMIYKRPHPPSSVAPYRFCPRCDRAYDMDGQQIENWAWVIRDGDWHRKPPTLRRTLDER